MSMDFFLLLLAACGSSETEAPEEQGPLFSAAVLDPPFEHGNAVWAGTALLDYDGDGWLDIYFTNGQSQADALYRNNADGTFTEMAMEAGLASLERHGGAVSGDVDNDGDPDLLVTTECSTGTLATDGSAIADGGITLYRNNGDGTFGAEPVPMPSNGLQDGICPVSLDLFDIDGEGSLDIVLSSGLDPDQIYPWIFRKEVREAVDRILLNDGSGVFGSQMAMYFDPPGDSPSEEGFSYQFVTFTSAFIDLDGNGVTERIAGFGGGPLGVLSLQDGEFYQYQPQLADHWEGLWMGLAVADYDGDGDLDVYATNQGLSPLLVGYDNIPSPRPGQEYESWYLENVNPFHSMYLNRGGRLELRPWDLDAGQLLAGDLFEGLPGTQGELLYPEWAAPEGLDRYGWGWGAVPLDADADGWMDVAFTGNNCSAPMDIIWSEDRGAGPGALLLNQKGEGFVDATWEWGVANTDGLGRYLDGRGIATGDLNNDGYADLVFANRTYNPSQSGPMEQEPGLPNVWLSGPRDGGWLQIDLRGTQSNRDGIGSLIWVDDGNRRSVYQLGSGGATNSSNERLLTIGLGDAGTVDIEVLFPSGVAVEKIGVESGQRIIVSEPE